MHGHTFDSWTHLTDSWTNLTDAWTHLGKDATDAWTHFGKDATDAWAHLSRDTDDAMAVPGPLRHGRSERSSPHPTKITTQLDKRAVSVR